jgi:transcriptional repressor NrdR
MRCPYCGHLQDKVVDSREGKDGLAIRRRRQCLKCNRRFTSYERIDEPNLRLIKKDGRREPFSREKLMAGLHTACKKRPVPVKSLEEICSEVEAMLQESPEKELPTARVGSYVMQRLKELDKVAYVRFASVYRQFEDVSEFFEELKALMELKKGEENADKDRERDSGREPGRASGDGVQAGRPDGESG